MIHRIRSQAGPLAWPGNGGRYTSVPGGPFGATGKHRFPVAVPRCAKAG